VSLARYSSNFAKSFAFVKSITSLNKMNLNTSSQPADSSQATSLKDSNTPPASPTAPLEQFDTSLTNGKALHELNENELLEFVTQVRTLRSNHLAFKAKVAAEKATTEQPPAGPRKVEDLLEGIL